MFNSVLIQKDWDSKEMSGNVLAVRWENSKF